MPLLSWPGRRERKNFVWNYSRRAWDTRLVLSMGRFEARRLPEVGLSSDSGLL